MLCGLAGPAGILGVLQRPPALTPLPLALVSGPFHQETTEYKREQVVRPSKRPAGVLSPTANADRDPAELTPDRSAKKPRSGTGYYSEQDIIKGLKGKPHKVSLSSYVLPSFLCV